MAFAIKQLSLQVTQFPGLFEAKKLVSYAQQGATPKKPVATGNAGPTPKKNVVPGTAGASTPGQGRNEQTENGFTEVVKLRAIDPKLRAIDPKKVTSNAGPCGAFWTDFVFVPRLQALSKQNPPPCNQFYLQVLSTPFLVSSHEVLISIDIHRALAPETIANTHTIGH
jgi:hypothetical protein